MTPHLLTVRGTYFIGMVTQKINDDTSSLLCCFLLLLFLCVLNENNVLSVYDYIFTFRLSYIASFVETLWFKAV